MIYIIYYRSAFPEQENTKIQELIKSFPGWAILSSSFFLVRKEYDEAWKDGKDQNLFEIKQQLNSIGSTNDEFFVSQLGNEAIWQGYGGRLKDWIIRNSLKKDEEEEFIVRQDLTQTAQEVLQGLKDYPQPETNNEIESK